jgi:hypothetical protein
MSTILGDCREGAVHNVPATVLYHIKSLVGNVGPSDFLLRPLTKHLTSKQFATDVDVKQAVTSSLDTGHQFILHWDTSLGTCARLFFIG